MVRLQSELQACVAHPGPGTPPFKTLGREPPPSVLPGPWIPLGLKSAQAWGAFLTVLVAPQQHTGPAYTPVYFSSPLKKRTTKVPQVAGDAQGPEKVCLRAVRQWRPLWGRGRDWEEILGWQGPR